MPNLLDLPPELRVRIFEFVVNNEKLYPKNSPMSLRHVSSFVETELFRVTHSIYEEVQEAFFKNRQFLQEFVLRGLLNNKLPSHWSFSVITNLKLVLYIYVPTIAPDRSTESLQSLQSLVHLHAARLGEWLRKFRSLQSLNLRIWGGPAVLGEEYFTKLFAQIKRPARVFIEGPYLNDPATERLTEEEKGRVIQAMRD